MKSQILSIYNAVIKGLIIGFTLGAIYLYFITEFYTAILVQLIVSGISLFFIYLGEKIEKTD